MEATLAEPDVARDPADVEDDDFEHEHQIVDRVLESIAPSELSGDVDPISIVYFLWCRLTSILLVCDYSSEGLVADVRAEGLVDAEPEGNA